MVDIPIVYNHQFISSIFPHIYIYQYVLCMLSRPCGNNPMNLFLRALKGNRE